MNKLGQTTVEYVLLLGVIGILAFAVINNERFRNFIGPNGEMFQSYASYMGYTYRHGREGSYTNGNLQEGYIADHDTYRDDTYRIPLELYPAN